MSVIVEQIQYSQWGDAVRITNGTVELVASLAFGPRILRYAFARGSNVFMEDTEGLVTNEGTAFDQVGGGQWRIYGGHRLWTSPEAVPRAAYPDNEPVAWRPTERGIALIPPRERWTHIQKTIEIELSDSGSGVIVRHRIENLGAWPIECAAWALTVLAKGGTAIIPQSDKDTGLLPNRVVALWPYSRMNDARVTWGEKFITIRQAEGPTPFKLGTGNEKGWAGYALGDQLFVKRYRHVAGGRYPDFGCSFESYAGNHMLELESLSELIRLEPGAALDHTEKWELHKGIALDCANEDDMFRKLGAVLA